MYPFDHTGELLHEGGDEGHVGNEKDPRRARHGRKVRARSSYEQCPSGSLRVGALPQPSHNLPVT